MLGTLHASCPFSVRHYSQGWSAASTLRTSLALGPQLCVPAPCPVVPPVQPWLRALRGSELLASVQPRGLCGLHAFPSASSRAPPHLPRVLPTVWR